MTELEVIQSKNFPEIQKLFVRPTFDVEQSTALAQYDVKEHDVFQESARPHRKVTQSLGTKKPDGTDNTQQVSIDVVRVGIAWQKIIVERRVGFMLSDPVKTNAIYSNGEPTDKEKKLCAMVEKVLNDNKMDYRNKEILRRKLTEMEVAVIWYYTFDPLTEPKFWLKCKVLSPTLGDTLYPLFDAFGSMVSFARGYKLRESGKDIEHFDVYTDALEYRYVNRGAWKLDDTLLNTVSETGEPITANPIPNKAGKILVEYYSQKEPVWNSVQSMISRHEVLASNHGGMNDKFGAPLLVVSGEIRGRADDNMTGSVLQVENGGAADYKQLASEPLSIKLEMDNLEKYIYSMSQTPNISFEQMKAMGQLSGFAVEMLFTDAHMAARAEEENFGMGIQRRLNILKKAIGALIDTSLEKEAQTLQLIPQFTPYLPKNTTELVNDLSMAVTSGILSKESAAEQNPFVVDPVTELTRLQTEAQNANAGL